MKQYLLIDIGGTFIKYSLTDEQARKISGGKVPTPLLAAIEGFATPLQGQFVGCAISMPGRIDTRNGIAHTGGMLSAFMWEQPFAAQVEARLGVPVTIANDGKCAAAAEGWTGALAGVENGLVLVLGTGIGGGIILNGKMFNGGMNHGVELGHAYLVDGGEPLFARRGSCGIAIADAQLAFDFCHTRRHCQAEDIGARAAERVRDARHIVAHGFGNEHTVGDHTFDVTYR